MLSRIVPSKSQVSWSTIPILRPQLCPAHRRDVDPVERDPPRAQLVEPHHQVDQRRLAGPGRPDDRDGLPRVDRRATAPRSAAAPRRSERDPVEDHLAVRDLARREVRRPRLSRPSSPVSSSASRSSKTRSADATPDWSRLTIEASWVSGWVNWREYWMNACTSPRLIAPEATRSPPSTATSDVVEVPDEHHHRHDQPGDELRSERGLEELVVLLGEESARTSCRRPNTLTSS